MDKKINILIVLMIFVLQACDQNSGLSDAYGNFEATEITVSAQGAGLCQYLNLEEGDSFPESQQVGLIDTLQLSLQKLQLMAQKRAVMAGIQGILSRIAVYEQQGEILNKDRKRIEQMHESGAATAKQVDDINGKIDLVKREINAVKTENAKVLANLESIDWQIKRLEDQISRQIITVPQKGVVLEKYVEAHEMVVVGKPLFKIADLEKMILRVYVSGQQLPHIKIGQKVKVFIDEDATDNREMDGTISWISSQSEFTPKIIQTKKERVKLVYAVKINVVNDGRVKIGMPAEVKIQ